MRLFAILLLLVSAAVAQQEPATTPCDFDDNMQMSVQYSPAGHDEPKNGKIWTPGGVAFTLYTQTPIVLNNVTIPVGAFSLAVIPGKKDWTLVVNKNVTAGAKYDQTQDIVRAPMETGEIGQAVTEAQVTLAHMGPKTCSFRIYFGKIGAFTEFKEK